MSYFRAMKNCRDGIKSEKVPFLEDKINQLFSLPAVWRKYFGIQFQRFLKTFEVILQQVNELHTHYLWQYLSILARSVILTIGG